MAHPASPRPGCSWHRPMRRGRVQEGAAAGALSPGRMLQGRAQLGPRSSSQGACGVARDTRGDSVRCQGVTKR